MVYLNIITCEQVSSGHPDKICDQIADAIVTDCLQHDPNSRVAIEVMLKDNHCIIAGELTSNYIPRYRKAVYKVCDRIGWNKLDYGPNRLANNLDIQLLVKEQSPDIALGVDSGGAGDQGMMFGYATNETPEMLPIPYVLATKFLEMLRDYPSDKFMADAKAQVSFDYDSNKITTFLCSTQHKEKYNVNDFFEELSSLMIKTSQEYGLNDDFDILINPTGRFVVGGSYGDCGVTGRKLACDTYGGVGHIGGGAMSGKDPTKVDRSGAYVTRNIAKNFVKLGYADKCEVQIAYAIGVAEPVSIHVETFGTSCLSHDSKFFDNFIRSNYDLTPKGIIRTFDLLNVDYNKVSTYGHFGKSELPWE